MTVSSLYVRYDKNRWGPPDPNCSASSLEVKQEGMGKERGDSGEATPLSNPTCISLINFAPEE